MNHRVDRLNFFLIWGCLGLALIWPFELFLFSYIVLGPIHYFTEINWLHKQNYFLRARDRQNFFWTMVAIVGVFAVFAIGPQLDQWVATRPLHTMFFKDSKSALMSFGAWSYILVLAAFVMSAAWVLTDRWKIRLVVIAFCLLSSLLFYQMPVWSIILGILVPTIVHVFLFTICFMLYGSIKSKSTVGYLNVISMFLCLLVIAIVGPLKNFVLTQHVLDLLTTSKFDQVNLAINNYLGNVSNGRLESNSGGFLKVQTFLAFAYTYHYLNWFSKTSIIKWHHVPKVKLVFSVVLWIAAVGLFFIDFRLGFAAGFALSALHVLLEFPLNYVSIHGVFHAAMLKTRQVVK